MSPDHSTATNGCSDLTTLGELSQRAWKVYRALVNAPEELSDVRNSILSLVGALRLVQEQVQETQLSAIDKRSFLDNLTRSNTVITGLEDAVDDLRAQRAGLEGVSSFAQKLLALAVRITSLYEVLRRGFQENILDLLEEIREQTTDEFQGSLVRDWTVLVAELEKHNIRKRAAEEEYFFITSWLKETYLDNGTDRSRGNSVDTHGPPEQVEDIDASSEAPTPRIQLVPSAPKDEELPGYTPGKKPNTIAEKTAHAQDQREAALILGNSVPNVSSNSKSAPPAYTFEEGSDQDMDDEFQQYIRMATEREARARYLRQQTHPEIGPHPYIWLPENIRSRYAERPDIVRMLDPKAFSVMAYETAPRLMEEIERLRPLLRAADDGNSGTTDGVIGEALDSLKTLSRAMPKFAALQDQRPGNDRFSDLDALDFEFSTATAVVSHLQYPEREFELAQKSCYLLLTYIMGMLELFCDIFPGRTYITRSKEDLERLWKDRKMATRTAWVEKRLANWGEVEAAIIVCRDWHRLRPDLRVQATIALKDWQKSQALLNSPDLIDDIKVTVLSASGLPKSRIGQPNYIVKVVLYAAGRGMSGCFRDSEVSTEISKNTQHPVWNQSFPIRCQKHPRFLELQVCDHVLGRDKEVGRVRLNFSIIPGVDMNFAERSLIYGYDEEITFPVRIVEGKGKEVEPPTVKVRLSWPGRIKMLEDSGLPTSAPGKMFRTDVLGISPPFEDDTRVAANRY